MFGSLGNLGQLASIVGKLKDIPQRMQQLNDRMRSERVSASSSCGHVQVTMNGIGEVQSVELDPVVVSGDVDGEVLGEAIRHATNAAGAAAKQMYATAVADLARDMDINIPGIEGMLSSMSGGS